MVTAFSCLHLCKHCYTIHREFGGYMSNYGLGSAWEVPKDAVVLLGQVLFTAINLDFIN